MIFKLKKIIIWLFLFFSLSIVSIFIYPWFYKTFMSLETIGKEQYSPNKKFKAQQYFVPYLHHSLGMDFYRMPRGYSIYRVTNLKTGEVFGDMEDKTFEAPFQFEGNNKFCIDLRFADRRTEDEWCLDLE